MGFHWDVRLRLPIVTRQDWQPPASTLESIVVEQPESPVEAPQHLYLHKSRDWREARGLVEVLGFTGHSDASLCSCLDTVPRCRTFRKGHKKHTQAPTPPSIRHAAMSIIEVGMSIVGRHKQ